MRSRRRLRRLRRALLVSVACLLVIAAAAWYIVAHTGVVGDVIASNLSERLGGDVEIGDVTMHSTRRVVLHDVRIRSLAHRGEAAEIVTADEVEIETDLSAMLAGDHTDLITINARGVLFRLSEDAHQSGAFSFMGLKPRPAQPGDRPTMVVVNLQHGAMEMGVHEGERYQSNGRLPVAGSLHTLKEDAEWLFFRLAETDDRGVSLGEGGLDLEGRLNTGSLAVQGRLTGFRFEPRYREMAPRLIERWWETLELDGSVGDVRITSEADGGLWASFDVADLGLTVPFLANGVWARYDGFTSIEGQGQPRMRVAQGNIELRESRIVLNNLVGELTSTASDSPLAGVPYRLNGAFGPVPQFVWESDAWLDQMLTYAPIDLSLYMDDFHFDARSEDNAAVELPVVVTKILEQFNLRSCTLSTNVEIDRAPPRQDEQGAWIAEELQTSGAAILRDGVGAYARFPYPLHNVSARLEFTSGRIDVVSLLGDGESGGRVSIGGRIAPLTNSPGVRLHISGQDVPLNNHLRDAMSGQFHGVFDAVMHRESLERLRAAGALADDDDRRRLIDEGLSLIRRRQMLEQDAARGVLAPELAEPGIERLSRRIASVDRALAQPRFELGGMVDFEIDVERAEGRDRHTYTTGRIEIAHAGLLLRHFPYPIRINSGAIELRRDSAVVSDWLGVSAGGGHVLINGRIETEAARGRPLVVRPEIQVGIIDDLLNETLIAAIPLAGGPAEQPQRDARSALATAAELLDAAGLDGMIACDGRIYSDAEGQPQWNIALALDAGSATPRPEMAAAMQRIGLHWPRGFALEDVSGTFRITPGRIDIARLEGHRGAGSVSASGAIDLDAAEPRTEIDLEFQNFAMEEYLLEFFGGIGEEPARALWDRYKPSGFFDATLAYRASGSAREPLELTVVPREVSIVVAGQPVTISGAEAAPATIRLAEDGVDFSNLRLSLHSAGGVDGEIELDGRYSPGGSDSLVVSGSIQAARFESPWVLEAFHLAGADAEMLAWKELQPSGVFDAAFSYDAGAAADHERIQIEVRPRSMRFVLNDAPVSATFNPESRAAIDAGRVRLHDLSGHLESGNAFAILGEITLENGIAADLNVSYRGREIAPELRALLPAGTFDTFGAIALHLGEWIIVRNATVEVDAPAAGDSGPGVWSADFDGDIDLAGASFRTGLLFDRIDGALHVSAGRDAHGAPHLHLDLAADRARVEGRVLTDVRAHLELTADARAIELTGLSAQCYGGALVATALTGLGEMAAYEATVDMVGINLNGFANAQVEDDNPEPSDAQGDMYGQIALSGVVGDDSSRRGRGDLRIMHGRLGSNPITLPLLQLSQLMLPLDASLRYGESSFYIEGDRVVMERLLFESDRLLLVGDGSISLDDFNIDVRLRSRGRVVGLSDLVGTFNDQIYAIHVTGPLEDTSARLVPLPWLHGFYEDAWLHRREPNALPPRGTAAHELPGD